MESARTSEFTVNCSLMLFSSPSKSRYRANLSAILSLPALINPTPKRQYYMQTVFKHWWVQALRSPLSCWWRSKRITFIDKWEPPSRFTNTHHQRWLAGWETRRKSHHFSGLISPGKQGKWRMRYRMWNSSINCESSHKRRGQQRMRQLDDTTDSMDMNLSKLREMVKDRMPGMLHSLGVTKSLTQLNEQQTSHKNRKYIVQAQEGSKG